MASASPALNRLDQPQTSVSRSVSISSLPAAAPALQSRRNAHSGLTSSSTSACMTPTWHGFIHTTSDALLVLEACLQGKLHHIPRRPHDRERTSIIASGNVFIYEENASGIKRWTDGVTWSPSRIMGNFLVYRELNEPFPAGEKKKAKKRKRGNEEPEGPENLNGQSEEDRKLVGSLVDSYGFKPNGLIKKTLNIKYNNVNHHIVSYYSLSDVKEGKYRRPNFDPTFDGLRPRQDLLHHQFKVSVVEPDDIDPFRDPHSQPVLPPSIHGHLGHSSPQPSMHLHMSNNQSMVSHHSQPSLDTSLGTQQVPVQQTSHTSVPSSYISQMSYHPQQASQYMQSASQFMNQPLLHGMPFAVRDDRHDSVLSESLTHNSTPDFSSLFSTMSTGTSNGNVIAETPVSHGLDTSATGLYSVNSAQPGFFSYSDASWFDSPVDTTPPVPKRRQTAPAGVMAAGMMGGVMGGLNSLHHPHALYTPPVTDHGGAYM